MDNNYIKGKGILVGTFTESDLKNKYDKIKVQNVKEETGLNYTNTELVKKSGKIIGLKIYACNLDDMKI